MTFFEFAPDNPPVHALPVNLLQAKKQLSRITVEAGSILLSYFGRVKDVRHKGATTSVVCEADLASEAYVIGELKKHFPGHSIISEESGITVGDPEYTWVIDPLDGTSNFVAGIPWFGVQIGLLQNGAPILASMYLPCDESLYTAQVGKGALRNDRRVHVTPCADLKEVLCAFGFDPGVDEDQARRTMAMLRRISAKIRNIRATNSLVDFCYTVDGRLGGAVNLNTKIWDIVPVSLILPEAGGKLTGLDGKDIKFDLSPEHFGRTYKVIAAPAQLHKRLAKVIFSE